MTKGINRLVPRNFYHFNHLFVNRWFASRRALCPSYSFRLLAFLFLWIPFALLSFHQFSPMWIFCKLVLPLLVCFCIFATFAICNESRNTGKNRDIVTLKFASRDYLESLLFPQTSCLTTALNLFALRPDALVEFRRNKIMNSDTIRLTFPWSLIPTFTKYFGVSNELNSSKISRLWPSSSEGWLCLCSLLTEISYVHRERESRINVIAEVNVYRILDTILYGSASKFICRLRDLFAFGKGRAAEFVWLSFSTITDTCDLVSISHAAIVPNIFKAARDGGNRKGRDRQWYP